MQKIIEKLDNNYFKILGIILVMIMAVLVWYSPVIFKGYPTDLPGSSQVVARNLVLTGKFSQESAKNVILNSERIRQEGTTSSKGDKLIAICNAGIYKLFGMPDANKAVLISVFVNALAFLFFFFTVWQLFNYKNALIFSGIYIFLPVIWATSLNSNSYEYAFLFLSISLFIFFSKWERYKWLKYGLVGIFLALCFLSRDAMALLAPAMLIWLWIYKRKAILPLFGSLLLVIAIFTFIFNGVFGKSSNYHLAFFRVGGESAMARDFGFYGHLYPDPYTYHYEKEDYLAQKKQEMKEGGLLARHGIAKRMSNVESSRISLLHHFTIAPILLAKHLASIISLENVGGPLIFLLFLLGLLYLFKNKKPLFNFCWLWIASVFFFCSFVALAQRNHVMDFGFIMALLVSLGIIRLAGLISNYEGIKNKFLKKNYLIFIILLLVIYQLVLSSHVVFGRVYDSSDYLKLKAYQEIILEADITAQDIMATPLDNSDIYTINYLTDKSIIKFDKNTVKKLLDENKLDFAFQEFKVTKILGFSPDMTKEILQQVKVENITDNDIEMKEVVTSPVKGLIMNLLR